MVDSPQDCTGRSGPSVTTSQRPTRTRSRKCGGSSERRALNGSGNSASQCRFSDAGDRERDDDALIDVIIAAEALFLPNERLELGYKLALRAAFFLAPEVAADAVRTLHVREDLAFRRSPMETPQKISSSRTAPAFRSTSS